MVAVIVRVRSCEAANCGYLVFEAYKGIYCEKKGYEQMKSLGLLEDFEHRFRTGGDIPNWCDNIITE